jgi:hypothetical protein
MNRRGTVAVLAVTALAAAGALPAFAAGATKAKPLKGTWSYTDVTPDPTPDASTSSNAGDHCHGKLPSAPSDVNSHTLKITRPGTLTVTTSVVGDWALEIRDAKGNIVAGDDANPPASEGALVALKKGAYAVVLCNLSGAPTATADYSFKPR